MKNVNINAMITRIEKIANSEKVTKKELGELSRELVQYLVIENSNDIGMVNRLLGVLTPGHRRIAVQFFDHFLFFKLNEDTRLFEGKMKGARKLDRYVNQASDFLSDDNNNIWTWQEAHLKIEKKPVDFAKRIKSDIAKALNAEENGLSQAEVMQAVLEGGVTLEAVLAIMDNMTQEAA